MKRTSSVLAGIFLASALSGCGIPLLHQAADDDTGCKSLDGLSAAMKKQYAEEPAFIAQTDSRSAMILFATPPGAKLENGAPADTWTLIEVPDINKNQACTFNSGEQFRMVTNRKPIPMPGLRDVMDTKKEDDLPTRPCMPHQNVMAMLKDAGGLIRLAYAPVGKNVMEVYGIPDGTTDVAGRPVQSLFSIIETNDKGISCLVSQGTKIRINEDLRAKYPKDPKPGF